MNKSTTTRLGGQSSAARMTQTHNARQGKQEVQHCDAGSGWAASRADRTNERRCHRTETASGDGAWGPGRGLCLKNEWKPLEDLQMVRCKVSCPPPQSLGCTPHAPRLHSGGGSGRLNGPGQDGADESRRARRIRRGAWPWRESGEPRKPAAKRRSWLPREGSECDFQRRRKGGRGGCAVEGDRKEPRWRRYRDQGKHQLRAEGAVAGGSLLPCLPKAMGTVHEPSFSRISTLPPRSAGSLNPGGFQTQAQPRAGSRGHPHQH